MAKIKLRESQEANYQPYKAKEPPQNMGAGSFANMPDKPMITTFTRNHQHRDGIINSFSAEVQLLSDIHEDRR